MSSPAPAAEPVQDSVRAKVRTALAKSLDAQLAATLDQKLAAAFPTSAAYTSAYRSLVGLLKPRTDTLTPDADVVSSSAAAAAVAPLKDSAGLPATGEFAHAAADLKSGKLRVGHVINRLQELEKAKKALLRESVATSASAATSLSSALLGNGSSALSEATQAASRARELGELHAQLSSTKRAIEVEPGLSDPVGWERLGDLSMRIFYRHLPNLAILAQAARAYNRVEALSTAHLNAHPAFYLKRAAIRTIQEQFALAVADLQTFASKAGEIKVAPSSAAAAAAASDSSSSSSAPASTPSSIPASALVAPRLAILLSFVATTSRLVSTRLGRSDAEISQMLRQLPNPSERQLSTGPSGQRRISQVQDLVPGLNEGKVIIASVLGKLDQTSLYALGSNVNPASKAFPLASQVALPLPSPWDSLETSFRTPASYVIVDGQGKACVLSLYNLRVDPSLGKQKRIRPGQSVMIFDPTVVDVSVEGEEKGGSYRSLQLHNPYACFVDREQIFTEADIASQDQ